MDVFDLVAKIRLDSSEYEQGIGKAKGTFSTLASGVGKGLATVAKVGAAAVSAGVAGVAALTKMGVDGYAQYEQLVGGVETLFKESGNAVKGYAENAYKTAGLSANAYMETATSFSASLIQSLGGDTAKAAEVADMAITDMSDNANKMGTSMEMIQHAYQGFSKQNYTMLDNLKLGYGGTKTEMERLLSDAQKLSGVKYDISSYADVVEAIHVIQENMGIAGTTAKEAASTIEGSLKMMKGAWENLVVGMADENANMEVLINDFVESTATAAQNLLPRIEQTLQGIGQLIEKMAPIIAEALPVLVESLLPTIITAGTSLVTALVNAIITALPALGTALLDAVKIILVDVFGATEEQANQFADGVTGAFNTVKDGFFKLVESAQTDGTWLNEIWTGLQKTGQLFADFLVALWDNLSAAFKWCVEQINTDGTWLNSIWQNIQTFISAAIGFIQGIIQLFTAVFRGDWESAWSAVEQITETFGNAIGAIVEGVLDFLFGLLGQLLQLGWDLIQSLWKGITNHFATFYTEMSGLVTDNIITPILNMGSDLYEAGVSLINQLWDGLKSVWNSIASWWDSLSFSDKTVNVHQGGGKGGYATGLNYVPYDEFPAILHRGEAVLTAAEARVWRNGGYGTPAPAGGITINQYIQSVPQTPVDLANATEAYFEQARWAL